MHHNENYREVMMCFYSDYYKILQELYHFREWQFSVGVTYDDVAYMDFFNSRDHSQRTNDRYEIARDDW